MEASAEMLPQTKIVCYFNHNIKNSVKVRKSSTYKQFHAAYAARVPITF